MTESTNIPRTNIYLHNENLWNWAKYQSKNRGYSSVSEYLFQLLENEKDNEVLDQQLLMDIEKYFEYNHYSLGDIANKNDISLDFLNNFLIRNSIPLDDTKKANSRIHSLLLKHHLAPREFYLFNQLSEILKLKKDFPSKRELLLLFYQDPIERRNELFSYAYELVPEISEKIRSSSKNTDFKKIEKLNIESILYNLGIDPDERDVLLEDPDFLDLKAENLEDYFFLAFDIAGWTVLSRDLIKIFSYYLSNAFQLFVSGINKIRQIISEIIRKINVQIQSETLRDSIIFNHLSILPSIDQFYVSDNVVFNTATV